MFKLTGYLSVLSSTIDIKKILPWRLNEELKNCTNLSLNYVPELFSNISNHLNCWEQILNYQENNFSGIYK